MPHGKKVIMNTYRCSVFGALLFLFGCAPHTTFFAQKYGEKSRDQIAVITTADHVKILRIDDIVVGDENAHTFIISPGKHRLRISRGGNATVKYLVAKAARTYHIKHEWNYFKRQGFIKVADVTGKPNHHVSMVKFTTDKSGHVKDGGVE